MRPNRFHWPTMALGAAIASLSILAGRLRPRRHGSQTNASDAIDDIELHPKATPEQVVDAGGMESFPASDPLAVGKAYETASERKRRGNGSAEPPAQPAPRRSADWLLRR